MCRLAIYFPNLRFNSEAYGVGLSAGDSVSISPSGRQVGGGRKRLT